MGDNMALSARVDCGRSLVDIGALNESNIFIMVNLILVRNVGDDRNLMKIKSYNLGLVQTCFKIWISEM